MERMPHRLLDLVYASRDSEDYDPLQEKVCYMHDLILHAVCGQKMSEEDRAALQADLDDPESIARQLMDEMEMPDELDPSQVPGLEDVVAADKRANRAVEIIEKMRQLGLLVLAPKSEQE